jgi:hypothetical protein
MIPQAEYLSEETVILALRSQYGNLNLTSAELSISRGQLQNYLVNHPAVLAERLQIKEGVKDFAEDLLRQKMVNSDTLLMFYLRTQAKDRGYGNEAAITGADGKALEVTINARSLIDAMRKGMMELDAEESEQEEISDLLDKQLQSIDI